MLADAISQLEIFLYTKREMEAKDSRLDPTGNKKQALEIIVACRTKTVPDPWLGDDVRWLVGELDFFS
jgi:hypothetical protein